MTIINRSLVFFATLALFAAGAHAATNPKVALETTKGRIVIELFADKAPVSVENFLSYVDAKFYNGTIFHRVIPGFMVQGGGFIKSFAEKPTRPPIKNEAKNGVKNERGTLAMARTSVVDSATAQFFINVADNAFLDYKDDAHYGYAVFGRVLEGMNIVDSITKEERLCPSSDPAPCAAGLPPGMRDVPKEAVTIIKAQRL